MYVCMYMCIPMFIDTLRLVFLAMSKFSIVRVKRIWRVLIIALFSKNNSLKYEHIAVSRYSRMGLGYTIL